MKTIIIKADALHLHDHDNGVDYKVNSYNGSGLFEVINHSNGEIEYLTATEIKKYGGEITSVYDALDALRYVDGETYYTDDDMNYISENELKNMPAEFRDDFEPVKFEVAN